MTDEMKNKTKQIRHLNLSFIMLLLATMPAYNSNRQFVAGSDLKIYPTVEKLVSDLTLQTNDVVQVLGYYEINDGGSAMYIVTDPISKNETINDSEYYLTLANGLNANLVETSSINYKIFGAKGDGINNDAIQIAKAHRYANSNDLPIVNKKGEYWLKEVEIIQIQTDVDWGNTIFHIDEKFNNLTDFRFVVTSKHQPKEIILSNENKEELLRTLKPGAKVIPVLEPYKYHFVVISDAKDRIGYRSGASFKGQSKSREDFFYVEESGRILGDITWSFSNYTKLTAYPVDKNYLTLQGGVFYLSGDSPSSPRGYFKNGIRINRSKTIISNQWLGMETGMNDTITSNPRSGFYSFSTVYDVTLENVRLMPYQHIRNNVDMVRSGTYGISMGRVLKSSFKNVTAEADSDHWGIFGTNLNKDFTVDGCHLNRVDIHFHCWNLTILNSHIGEKGITVTGGGNLVIDNSSCAGQRFVSFRSDYGSKWDGDIKITNSTLRVIRELKNFSILSFAPSNFDYKYPIRFGKRITIENFKVDFRAVENKDAICWIMTTPRFSEMDHGDRISLPEYIKFENIHVVGRDKGLRLLSLANQGGYEVDKAGEYSDGILTTNASISFENIQLEDISQLKNQYHFIMTHDEKSLDEHSFYPSVHFSNCSNIAIDNKGLVANFFFEKCNIAHISGQKDDPLKGRFVFSNCEFSPIVDDDTKVAYSLHSSVGTFFSNCIIHPPVVSEELRADLIDQIGFLKMNKSVDFNHSNTLLDNKILKYYEDDISTAFMQMLRNNYQVKSDFIEP